MSSDIIDWRDYTFVKDEFTRLYDVLLHDKLIDSGLTLNSAYHAAEKDWDSRYPHVIDESEYHESSFDHLRDKHTFEIRGIVVRNCNTVEPEFKCVIDAESFCIAQLKAKMIVSTNYGKDCFLRDIRIRRCD